MLCLGAPLKVDVIAVAEGSRSIEIELNEAPSVLALDGEGERLFALINSGIGVLWKFDLRDGGKTEAQGIFAGAIW